MDGTRFDDLTRLLARTVSRRTALKGAVAAIVARGPAGPAHAAQQTCPMLEPCAQGSGATCVVLEATGGECLCAFEPMTKAAICSRPTCASDAECPADQRCATGWCDDGIARCHGLCESQAGEADCPSGMTSCATRCTDLSSDIWNCGACGHQCAFGGDQPAEICVDGRCVCPPEYTGSCGQQNCTNEQIDIRNCGTCGNVCREGQLCCSGQCVSRGDAERFCDWCGYLGGWPQGCLDDEVCDHGVCVGGAASAGEPAPDASAGIQPSGDLAYSVKNGGHWDIWVYSFDTQQNTQLTSDPYSDQWAPAYSHDGTRLAYLSDRTDGSNQIWMMNPDGSDQRQMTNWYGGESIIGVAWSPDDSQLIVTLFGDARRLAVMSSAGGELYAFVGVSSSFASTGRDGTMVFASDNGDPLATSIYLGTFGNPAGAAPFALGDAPVVSPDAAYVVVQIGAVGGRHIATYPLVSGGDVLLAAPRVGDDSDPVWATANHDYLAFVSAGPNGETIQVARLGDATATRLAIAPHERVWYLSKRFGVDTGTANAGIPEHADGSGTPPTPVNEIGLAGNRYTSGAYGFAVEWTDAWEAQDEYTGIQDDGSDRLVLWYTGGKVAAVDFRASSSFGADPGACVDAAIASLQNDTQFEDDITPVDAPALVPPPGAAGRMARNFLERDYLYSYVECRSLANGTGMLRIVYQVPDDTYALVYPTVVELLASVRTG